MIDKKSCNIHDLVGYKQNIVKIMLEVLYFLIVEHSSKHIATHGHDIVGTKGSTSYCST
jgi:hypothetical protein